MIVVDYYIDEKLKLTLQKYGELIFTYPNKNIMSGIDAHPDLLIRDLGEEIVVDKEHFNYYKNILKDRKLVAIDGIKSPYPNHVKLNFAVFKNFFIHNLKYTDKYVLEYFKKRNYKLIDVKQGYTKCNITVGKNSLITSDVGVYEKLKGLVDILLIDHKQIKLRNFNYGFIGGASGLVGDRLLFTGSLKNHSSADEMFKFLEKCGEEFEFLSDEEIVDVGSILEIGRENF